MDNTDSFSSRHFRLEQLADGVYAGIHVEGGWAICNVGIIDLGDRTLVFDAFQSTDAARDLRHAAENLIDNPIHAVINSHYHSDHIWGNQVFDSGVDIISSAKTRELIATEGSKEVQDFRDVSQKRLEILEAQYAEARDETVKASLKLWIDEFQGVIATLPELNVRLPNLTFNSELTFIGPKRSARLIDYEGGHCGSDAVLHLPEDGIVFMGDLLFTEAHPTLAEGDADKTQSTLVQVRKLQAGIFVPGHGPVGQAASLDELDEYINTLRALVCDAIHRGATEAEIEKIGIPGKFQSWIFPTFFATNLKSLYHRQIDGETGSIT